MFLEAQYFRIITTDDIKSKIKLSIAKKRKVEENRKYRNSEEGRIKQSKSKKLYTKTEHCKAKRKE